MPSCSLGEDLRRCNFLEGQKEGQCGWSQAWEEMKLRTRQGLDKDPGGHSEESGLQG